MSSGLFSAWIQPLSYVDLVGDELSRGEDRLHLTSELRSVCDGGAEDVARRDVRDAEALGHQESLGPLACSGRAHEDDAHQRRNPS